MLRNSGIGTYIKNIVNRLPEKFSAAEHSACLFVSSPLLEPHLPESFSKSRFHARIYSIHEQLNYASKLAACKVWHSPHYNIPISKGKTKLVVTIHDIIHWIFRKDFLNPIQAMYADYMLHRAVQISDHIITVSEHTKKDLVRHLRADPEKITVTYEAVSDKFKSGKSPEDFHELQKKYGIGKSFFLYVGLMKPHKNVVWLIREFQKAVQRGKIKSSLVLVGKRDPKYSELNAALSKNLANDRIHILESVESSELSTLYHHALALVHPSLYEGFGLTLLESMACGTPVIACNTSSIPEVVGNAALLFNPNDAAAFLHFMHQIEDSEQTRLDLIQKGLQNIRRFDWQKTADETFQVYEKVLSTCPK